MEQDLLTSASVRNGFTFERISQKIDGLSKKQKILLGLIPVLIVLLLIIIVSITTTRVGKYFKMDLTILFIKH